jgi:hypothetical protein
VSGSGIIDRREWLRQRVRHLETFLEGDISDEQRASAEAALEDARDQLRYRPAWFRWLLGGGHLPH